MRKTAAVDGLKKKCLSRRNGALEQAPPPGVQRDTAANIRKEVSREAIGRDARSARVIFSTRHAVW